MIREKVEQLLNQALENNPNLFLIDLEITPDNQITVIIDGDEGVTVEDCIAVSREIEHNLDREEIDFALQVMSAGVSTPLTMPRQYKKNVGHTLNIKKSDGEIIEGELQEVLETSIKLQWKAREPKPVGKGKVTVLKEAEIPFTEIETAKVMIIFN